MNGVVVGIEVVEKNTKKISPQKFALNYGSY